VRHLRTEIEIDATADALWSVLADLRGWAEWNPAFHDVDGDLAPDARLSFRIGAGSRMRIRPRVIDLDPGRTFAWRGRLFGIPHLFDGEHRFTLEPVSDGRTRLVHEERFSGVLAGPILAKIADETRASFEQMNAALKARVESAVSVPPGSPGAPGSPGSPAAPGS
jgi:hypothetical protein